MTTTPATIKPIDEVRASLQKLGGEFKNALPEHMAVDKFQRIIVTALQNNPDLLTAERPSLYSACMKAAQDGLWPDGREAALVMYGPKVQYMPMMAGLYKKIRNSGELASITSQMIHKNDHFRFWVDADGEHLTHEPKMFLKAGEAEPQGGLRGEAIGVYALAKTKDGAVYIEVMDKSAVMAVKAVSRAKNGPWNGPFEPEMWRKTVTRRLSKRLPMSTDKEQELQRVIERDDEMYDLKGEDKQPPTNNSSRLRGVIDEAAPEAAPAGSENDQAL